MQRHIFEVEAGMTSAMRARAPSGSCTPSQTSALPSRIQTVQFIGSHAGMRQIRHAVGGLDDAGCPFEGAGASPRSRSSSLPPSIERRVVTGENGFGGNRLATLGVEGHIEGEGGFLGAPVIVGDDGDATGEVDNFFDAAAGEDSGCVVRGDAAAEDRAEMDRRIEQAFGARVDAIDCRAVDLGRDVEAGAGRADDGVVLFRLQLRRGGRRIVRRLSRKLAIGGGLA